MLSGHLLGCEQPLCLGDRGFGNSLALHVVLVLKSTFPQDADTAAFEYDSSLRLLPHLLSLSFWTEWLRIVHYFHSVLPFFLRLADVHVVPLFLTITAIV